MHKLSDDSVIAIGFRDGGDLALDVRHLNVPSDLRDEPELLGTFAIEQAMILLMTAREQLLLQRHDRLFRRRFK